MKHDSVVRPGIVLAVCCSSIFISSLDASIVNVALPDISHELGSGERIAWIIDGYTLALASFLISSGVLADKLGRRRCFRIGLTIFAVGSLLCSLATGMIWLIIARILQGIGASMLNPVALAIISSVFTKPAERTRALGIWGAALGAALALGPPIGGVLVDYAGWKSIFWVNVPICMVVLWGTRSLPESRGNQERKIGLLGQALTVAAMFLLVLALIEIPHARTNVLVTGGAFLGFLISATAATIVLLRSPHPFIDLRVFRSPSYRVANISAWAGSSAQSIIVFTLALFLQSSQGKTAIESGLMMIPMAAGLIIFSTLSGRIMNKWGARTTLLVGGIGIALGALLLLYEGTTTLFILLALALYGAGSGLSNNPIAGMAVAGMGQNAGAASAVMVTCRQLGISVGVALAGSLADPARGENTISWIMVLCCGVAIVLSAQSLPKISPAVTHG